MEYESVGRGGRASMYEKQSEKLYIVYLRGISALTQNKN
jgi:hypothetical protein